MAKKQKNASKAEVQSTELNQLPDAEFAEELGQNRKAKKKNRG